MRYVSSPEKLWAKQRRNVILDPGARIASAKGAEIEEITRQRLPLYPYFDNMYARRVRNDGG